MSIINTSITWLFSNFRTIFIIIFCICSQLHAETYVYENQYIVVAKNPEVRAVTKLTQNISTQRLDKNNTSQLVIFTNGSQLSTEARIISGRAVPYVATKDRCAELMSTNNYSSCSPNFRIRIDQLPNDTEVSLLWGLAGNYGSNAYEAWDKETGSNSNVVAIIDTGIDYNHDDLKSNIWINNLEIPNNGIDDDDNGVIDDIHGYNALANSGDPLDDNGHGTHCAGTIGAVGNNSIGVVGINWRVKMMALKFLDSKGYGSVAGAIKAIKYMVEMKKRGVNIRISNNSWGGGSGYSEPLAQAINEANEQGILFVAAAGNGASDTDSLPQYPSSIDSPNVISVASLDPEGNLSSFSNYGIESVDIAAPGRSILSTFLNNSYKYIQGTSMATPHVSGALALLLASESHLSNDQLIARLRDTAVPLNTLNGIIKWGRTLNVNRMVNNISTPIIEPHEQNCRYKVKKIRYRPDSLANNSSIIQDSDESNFKHVILPFKYSFFGKQYSSAYISPNGVLYTKQPASAYDYVVGKAAPLNSIAVLHTDLTTTDRANNYLDGTGVRFSSSADRAVFYWHSRSYENMNLGNIDAHAVIHSNGIIETFYRTSNSKLAEFLADNAITGITGKQKTDTKTFTKTNKKIRKTLGLRYTPICQ